jgi:Fe-S cluster assembly protein SufD
MARKISPVAQQAVAHYIAESQQLNANCENQLVIEQRNHAQQLLQERAFPTLRDENWQYTKLTQFVQQHFKVQPSHHIDTATVQACLPSFAVTSLVFVDGWFSEELSDDLSELPRGVSLESARDVTEVPGGTEKLYEREVAIEDEPFGLLNTLLLADGFYLSVDANIALELPIFVLHLQTQDGQMANVRNRIDIGANAELTLVESYLTLGDQEINACSNVVTEIEIAKQARVKQVILQQQGGAAYYFNNQYVYQAENSVFNTFYAGLGSLTARHQNHLWMNGEHIESRQNSACLASGKQTTDSRTDTQHNDVWGASQQLHKYVLADQATGVFNGMIRVDQKAQKTDGQMDNKNLLLSDSAKMDSKPQLEIYADDVKCSHGSASGQIDKNQIFYLQARGIPRAQAVQMITRAFLMEPAEEISNPQIRKWIMQALDDGLQALSSAS